MKNKKIKLTLTQEECLFIKELLLTSQKHDELFIKISDALFNLKLDLDVSYKKRNATKKATEVRSEKAKEKIQNAINLLQLENKAITHYSIANVSGVSFNTVKKHIPDIDIIGKL